MVFIPWVSGADVELGIGLGESFPGDSDVALVENVILGLHSPQMKTFGFLGAAATYCSNENK